MHFMAFRLLDCWLYVGHVRNMSWAWLNLKSLATSTHDCDPEYFRNICLCPCFAYVQVYYLTGWSAISKPYTMEKQFYWGAYSSSQSRSQWPLGWAVFYRFRIINRTRGQIVMISLQLTDRCKLWHHQCVEREWYGNFCWWVICRKKSIHLTQLTSTIRQWDQRQYSKTQYRGNLRGTRALFLLKTIY